MTAKLSALVLIIIAGVVYLCQGRSIASQCLELCLIYFDDEGAVLKR